VALEFLPSRNRCPAFDKDKYFEPMFGDVGQALMPGYAELPIATTSSRTCTKLTVHGVVRIICDQKVPFVIMLKFICHI